MQVMQYQTRQPKPLTSLVQSLPVQEGTKLSPVQSLTWEDAIGLSYVLSDDW